MKYDLVCVDMFQTLVDLNTRTHYVWKQILQDKYSHQQAEHYAQLMISKVSGRLYDQTSRPTEFENLKSIFELYFSEIFAEETLDCDPKKAARIFVQEHGYAESYTDTDSFFDIVGNELPICLVSDADNEMIIPLLERFSFDRAFISEKVESYKSGLEGKIFKQVLNHYEVAPERVIHIGDSSADVMGANRVGIASCWLNRYKRKWQHESKPKYTVGSLSEIPVILGIDSK